MHFYRRLVFCIEEKNVSFYAVGVFEKKGNSNGEKKYVAESVNNAKGFPIRGWLIQYPCSTVKWLPNSRDLGVCLKFDLFFMRPETTMIIFAGLQ